MPVSSDHFVSIDASRPVIDGAGAHLLITNRSRRRQAAAVSHAQCDAAGLASRDCGVHIRSRDGEEKLSKYGLVGDVCRRHGVIVACNAWEEEVEARWRS